MLRVQNDPEILILHCPNCKGSSASRLPKSEALLAYYAEYRQDTDLKVTFHSPERFAANILRLVKGFGATDSVRILDFGGGDGSLSLAIAEQWLASTRNARQVSVSIDVIDYSQQPISSPNASIQIRRLTSLHEITPASYDLAIASAVMEHIPEPDSEFRSLFGSLKPGGYLYVRTPYVVPFLKVLDRLKLAVDFTYPAHVHDLGKDFWEGLVPRLFGEAAAFRIRYSHPSQVETTLKHDPLRTIAAHLLKLPWRLAPDRYSLVGGWEALFERVRENSQCAATDRSMSSHPSSVC